MHGKLRKPPRRYPNAVTISGSKQFDENGVIPITVKKIGDITDLRDRYGYNLPLISNVVNCNANLSTQTHSNGSYWHNRGSSPAVVRLLFTGRLPLNFFTEICYGRKVVTPIEVHQRETIARKKDLWEPKGDIKEACRKKIIVVNEARFRHRKCLEQIEKKAQEHQKQMEVVLMRQKEVVCRGLSCYLNKMERESERLMKKWKKGRPTDSSAIPLGECTANTDVFITKSGKHTAETEFGSDDDF